MKLYQTRWRWGLTAALPIMVLAALPQVMFLIDRGREWNGANAVMHPDEVAYSAYVASLIRGRPRRNDPYTARLDTPSSQLPESLFSIQIVPAFPLAVAAGFLGLTAANLFMVLPVFCAAFTAFAVFWFIGLLTHDDRFAAVAVWFILLLGTTMAGQGVIRHILNLPYLIPQTISNMVAPPAIYHLPFLRLYQPAVAFPLFFLLAALMWLALSVDNERKSFIAAIGAGISFALLVFSYFFLWTAALAWLVCLGALWLIAVPMNRRRTLRTFAVVTGFAVPVLVLYFSMLSHRASTADSVVSLVFSRRPDPFRFSEIVSLAILLLLVWGVRRRYFQWTDRVVLFTAALALAVLALFNQQILTGRSLQPTHYEWFIGNYCALSAAVVVVSLCWRSTKRPIFTNRHLAVVALFCLLWGTSEVWLAASLNASYNRMVDVALPVANRLRAFSEADGTRSAEESGGAIPVVLMANLALADVLPGEAPQSVLWAPRMLVFPGVTEDENQARFFKQLYYLGFDEHKFYQELDRSDWNFYAGLFPYSRLSPSVTGETSPISREEIRLGLLRYQTFAQSFVKESAATPRLSYLVLSADNEPNYSNLDRWYQRDEGERIGGFIIYRLTLRD